MQKYVNLVDLVKSFPTSIYLKNRRRYSRERASQSSEENSIHYSFASSGLVRGASVFLGAVGVSVTVIGAVLQNVAETGVPKK